ncbi:MAG: ABC transporter permease subunit [Chloroflexi bacterium]|nr:ABC transporter permease subunit [Chloroflexota bacterium]
MTHSTDSTGTPPAPPKTSSSLWAWLGLVPFFLFAIAFLLLPSLSIFFNSFQDKNGSFTFKNILDLSEPFIRNAYWNSISISLVTAIGGGIFGFFLAYAVTLGGLPRFVRPSITTFSGVASNFAGVPLAFAFISTLGRAGMVTVLLRDTFNFSIYDAGFNLYSFWGLSLVYMYFQFPLMLLIMTPALDGLRREWREAAENLGANSFHYWRYIAMPILLPSLLGSMILLFGNSFGAYATAYALTSGGAINLITNVIGAQISGDVLNNQGLGYALALGMVVIMSLSLLGYSWLQRQTERWIR